MEEKLKGIVIPAVTPFDEKEEVSVEMLAANYEKCIRIPMKVNKRSLNLSNSVAVIAFEVLRQFGFENLEKQGRLTGRAEG